MTSHAPSIHTAVHVPHLPGWVLRVAAGILLIAMIVVSGPQPVPGALHHGAHAGIVPTHHNVPAQVVPSH